MQWLWPAATIVSTSCAVLFGVLLVLRAGDPAAGVGDLAGPPRTGARAPVAQRQDGTQTAPATMKRPDSDPRGDAEVSSDGSQSLSVSRSGQSRLASGFTGRELDPQRMPAYLRMRQLVLEQGIEALSSSSYPRTGETIADAHPARSQTLRAIDRPGRTDSASGDLFEGTFPVGDRGRL